MSSPQILSAAAICATLAAVTFEASALPTDMDEMCKKLTVRWNNPDKSLCDIAITQKFGGKALYGRMTWVLPQDTFPPGIEVHVSIHSDSAHSKLIHKVKLDMEKDKTGNDMTGREFTDPSQKGAFLRKFPNDPNASKSYDAMVNAFVAKVLEWMK